MINNKAFRIVIDTITLMLFIFIISTSGQVWAYITGGILIVLLITGITYDIIKNRR